MLRAVVFALLAVSAFAADNLVTTMQNGTSTVFMVDWKKGADVSYSMQYFKIGDIVALEWDEYHDAVVVPASTDPCATQESQYIKVLAEASNEGTANYTITSMTPFWIICTVGQHCSAGNQKIMFMMNGMGDATNGTTSMVNSTMTMTPPRAPMTGNSSRSSNSAVAAGAAISSLMGAAFLAALFA